MRFGCHLSIREGYLGAAKKSVSIGAKAFQYFPKNPRTLSIKDYNETDTVNCKEYCQQNGLISVSHTPYSTSLTPSENKKDFIIQSLLNDLEITDACGSVGAVVHFGSEIHKKDPLKSYQLMIEMLNHVLSKWEGGTKLLLENNAGKPGSFGTTLEELIQVRNLCDYPEKIGFCLDTCHAFSSGLWNGDNWDDLLETGKKLGYFDHLKAIHLNNSKYDTGSGKDRHANITEGFIKENQFEQLILTPELKGIPFILETPSVLGWTHESEIKMLYDRWGTKCH
ncbi:deoxyribonuclease IV [Metabacillus arenae]|uniref:Deoxyribonuclease IV n=1 Tax=Metabacillus arenae TaxID=2771434 RepID=A0A926NCH0_9BACI|nr:deoxyribonuclease IV [Metabacillus arenae]MBD1381727.1 deoxyribonuclease IV [Metabacillus arenae]